MRGRFFQNLKASTLQLLLNQAGGLIAFYILAMALPKQEFGAFNWALAFLLTIFGILSFGLDQVIVRKIAAGENADRLVSIFISHTVITGLLFFSTLLLFSYFSSSLTTGIILLLGTGKFFMFLSTPLKQLPAGKEIFRKLLYMSVVSSLLKALGLLILALNKTVTLEAAIRIYMISDIIEFVTSVYIAKKHFRFRIELAGLAKNYGLLIRESWPQAGSVVFHAAMARLDWLLIGILLTTTQLAEYSFAYRVFEMTLLPLWIIGPLLLPYFSRRIAGGRTINGAKARLLFRTEMIIASGIALVLALSWAPVIDHITNGRYGAVNRNTIQLLAACMPLIYINNFLWSIVFSQNKLKILFGMVAIALAVNLAANLLLIPVYGSTGAAAAFFLATAVQTGMFVYHTRKEIVVIYSRIMLIPASTLLVLLMINLTGMFFWPLFILSFLLCIYGLYQMSLQKNRQLRFIKLLVNR